MGDEILGGMRHQIVRQLLHYSRAVIFITKLFMFSHDSVADIPAPDAELNEGKLKWTHYVLLPARLPR